LFGILCEVYLVDDLARLIDGDLMLDLRDAVEIGIGKLPVAEPV
jgi:hypothetical protein